MPRDRESISAWQKRYRARNAAKIKEYRSRPEVRDRNRIRLAKKYLEQKRTGTTWWQVFPERSRKKQRIYLRKIRARRLFVRQMPKGVVVDIPPKLLALTERMLALNETYELYLRY